MGIFKGIAELFSFFNVLLKMFSDSKLRKQGYKKAKEEVEKGKAKTNEIKNKIDNSPDVDKPWDGL